MKKKQFNYKVLYTDTTPSILICVEIIQKSKMLVTLKQPPTLHEFVVLFFGEKTAGFMKKCGLFLFILLVKPSYIKV